MSVFSTGKQWLRWWRGESGESVELEPLFPMANVGQKNLKPMPSTASMESTEEEDEEIENGKEYACQVSAKDTREKDFQSKTFCTKLLDWMYPSDVPLEMQMLRLDNIAIPTSYLLIGISQGLSLTFLNVYPLDMGATEAQQTSLMAVINLPAVFKILYGYTTDNFPVLGYRRKPYIFLGWLSASLSMAALLTSSNLSLPSRDSSGVIIPPHGAPSMLKLAIFFFLAGVFAWFADCTCDAVVVEKARQEPESMRGSMQATCYTVRFVGTVFAAIISTFLYSHVGPPAVILAYVASPVLIFPLVYFMKEERNVAIQSISVQCREIWATVCSRSVWQPMGYMFLFNICQVGNSAWKQFLSTVVGFTAAQLNGLIVSSYLMTAIGAIMYKTFFIRTDWRHIFVVCILSNGFFSMLQILLIEGNTFGLPPFLFALGDDAFVEVLKGVQFIVGAVMMMALCPPGSEGASYALLTTFWNSAMVLAPSIATLLLGIWDTSKETLAVGDLDGLLKLTLLTTFLQTLPIILLGWLPSGQEELRDLAKSENGSSVVGGTIFLAVLGLSLLWTLLVSTLNIVAPGWSGG